MMLIYNDWTYLQYSPNDNNNNNASTNKLSAASERYRLMRKSILKNLLFICHVRSTNAKNQSNSSISLWFFTVLYFVVRAQYEHCMNIVWTQNMYHLNSITCLLGVCSVSNDMAYRNCFHFRRKIVVLIDVHIMCWWCCNIIIIIIDDNNIQLMTSIQIDFSIQNLALHKFGVSKITKSCSAHTHMAHGARLYDSRTRALLILKLFPSCFGAYEFVRMLMLSLFGPKKTPLIMIFYSIFALLPPL